MRSTALAAALVFTTLAVGADSAEAQTRRGSRAAPAPTYGYSTPQYSYPGGRGYDLYSRQPGYSGAIQWNTPNASGNFGGPGTGGGGPGG